ncbi:uncharacterized protein [Cardiocondyla obscurior]|uniref:uncharacterized protein n=1 Tax=Cardiocondyla obscurior TaxID=286306 RepID=UPI0039656DDA
MSLGRLMPNLGGPLLGVRRLYAAVVRSIVPMELLSGRTTCRVTRERWPVLSRRSVKWQCGLRLYRTTAADAAAVMAGIPPLDIEAKSYASVTGVGPKWPGGDQAPASALAKLRLLCRRQVMSQWGSRLMAMTPDAHGFRVIGAVRPHFQQWMDGVM